MLVTLVYLAVQVRHSKTLLERNEKIALSQVHQGRTEFRLQMHMMQFSEPSFNEKIAGVIGNPDAIDGLNSEEFVKARALMMALLVIQDNALYQDSLGLLDENTLEASQGQIVRNYPVWQKLAIPIMPRIEECYRQHLRETDT